MLLCWIGTLNSYDYYYDYYEKDEKTCNCINPFAKTADRNLGDPDILCNLRPSQRRCYIEAYKNCTDSQKASGIRRWTSKIACVLRQPKLCQCVPEKLQKCPPSNRGCEVPCNSDCRDLRKDKKNANACCYSSGARDPLILVK